MRKIKFGFIFCLIFLLLQGCKPLKNVNYEGNATKHLVTEQQKQNETIEPKELTAEPDELNSEISGTLLIVSSDLKTLYVFSDENIEPVRIKRNDITHPSPALSPDGTRILIRTLQETLVIHNILTGEDEIINARANGVAPMGWSPDGGQIAFGCSLSLDICVYDLETEEVRNITEELTRDKNDFFSGYYFAGWSEDGEKIGLVFRQSPPSTGGRTYYLGTIFIMDMPTKSVTKVFSETSSDEIEHIHHAWISPGGSFFLFSAATGGGSDYTVFLINSNGTGLTQIIPESTEFDIVYPVWSPDGNSFAAAFHEQETLIIKPTIFDLSGGIVGHISITGGGEVASWINKQ